MELSCCREILVLSRCLNFGDAAEQLYITQSALSKHVAAAEKELGFRIFDRSTTKVELTEAGEVFVENLHDVLESYDRAVEAGRSHSHSLQNTIRVVGPLLNERILGLITAARARLALRGREVRLSITDTGVRDCYESLVQKRADLAIVFRYGWSERQLRMEHLFTIPFGIACHVSHPLASKSPLLFEDVSRWRIVDYPLEDRRGYHRFVDKVCRKHAIQLPSQYPKDGTIPYPSSEDEVVFGVHFLGYGRMGADIVTRPLDEDCELFDVCVACRRKEADQNILLFYDALVQEARQRRS